MCGKWNYLQTIELKTLSKIYIKKKKKKQIPIIK